MIIKNSTKNSGRRNYFTEEIKQNELISKKHKKVCKILDYTEHLLMVVCTVTWCGSVSPLASLVGISVSNPSSAITIKIFLITGGIKKSK